MSIKAHLSGILRKANLLSAAEKARFYWQKWKYKKDNEEFKREHRDFALPPEFFIYETYRLNYKWYHDDGMNTAQETITLLSKYLDITKPGIRILDWGCGPGRIIRHFPALLPNAEVHGCDFNEDYIKWCSNHLRGIHFSLNKIDPPTIHNDNFFDIVTGFSIFTHLAEKGHHDWMNELYRLVKPSGFVVITTQGSAYYSKLTSTEKKLFDAHGLVTRKYQKEGNRLFSSFQSPAFMKKLIAGQFQVMETTLGNLKNDEPSQDIWLLKKL